MQPGQAKKESGQKLAAIVRNVEARYTNASEGIHMDWKLELVAIPVTDVDRAKAFYEKIGFEADHDHTVSDDVRFVQLTPPGSACSIALGKGITQAAPGSVEGVQLVVEDADRARADLLGAGVEVGGVQEFPWGPVRLLHRPRRQWLGRAGDRLPVGASAGIGVDLVVSETCARELLAKRRLRGYSCS